MLSRTHIRQFLAIVDTGSFTRAANALNITQPSLSAGVAELERQLGTRLFVRERRRIQLTNAGNQLLPQARTIEREFRRAENQIGKLPPTIHPIRLGLLETLPNAWLESALTHYPGPEPLELTEGGERELQSALTNGSIDLAVTITHGEADNSRGKTLFREGYFLALPVTHPLSKREAVTADMVAGETMIARRSCEVLTETSRFFTERGVRPRFSLRSPNDDRVMAMVRAGMGVTVAPRSLQTPGVTMVPLTEFKLHRTIGLAFASHWTEQFGTDHAIVQAFCDTAPSV